MHRSERATALFGMAGFVLGAQLEVDGELWLYVETTGDVVGCAGCGTRAVGHGRRRVRVRDLPIAGRPVVLVWAKRLWRCPDPDCEVKTWSERSDAMRPRAELTERARAEICRRVGQDEDSVTAVARGLRCGLARRDGGGPGSRHALVEDPARLDGVEALGLDETRFLSATLRHRTQYVTGFVDLDRARLLDIVPGRSAKGVEDWLEERPETWLVGIDVVALDPFRGYANGLLALTGPRLIDPSAMRAGVGWCASIGGTVRSCV